MVDIPSPLVEGELYSDVETLGMAYVQDSLQDIREGYNEMFKYIIIYCKNAMSNISLERLIKHD